MCIRDRSWGRESVRQQFAFSCDCAIANRLLHFKEAGQSLYLVHIPALIHHFLVRHFLAKHSFHSSVCLLRSCLSGRLMKTGSSTTSRMIKKLKQQTFREEYQTNILLKSSLVVHLNAVTSVMSAVFSSLSFMLACMTLWICVLLTYQNMCIMLKIQSLHLKWDCAHKMSGEHH